MKETTETSTETRGTATQANWEELCRDLVSVDLLLAADEVRPPLTRAARKLRDGGDLTSEDVEAMKEALQEAALAVDAAARTVESGEEGGEIHIKA